MKIFTKKTIFVGTVFMVALLLTAPVNKTEAVDRFSLNINPQTQGPGQTVTVNISGSSRDLNRVNIEWALAGDYSSLNKERTRVSFVIGDLGSQVTVTASVTGSAGQVLNLTETIKPTKVDIFWEGGGYTPPFYSGRSMPVNNGELNLQTVVRQQPNSALSSDGLVFLWRLDGIRVTDRERGRDTLTLSGSQLRYNPRISVEIRDLDNQPVGRQEIFLRQSSPQLLINEKNDNLGIVWERDLASREDLRPTIENQVSLQVVPLFFSVRDLKDSQLSSEWRLNGRLLTNENRTSLNQALDLTTGLNGLTVQINNRSRSFQTAFQRLNITSQ